jgi:hypothetical protein
VKEGFLCGNPAAAPFQDLDDFYNRGQLVHLEEFFVYEHEWLITKILIPVKEAGYSRASIEDAANALIFTPDPDFVGKLILADHVHPMAPWLRQTEGTIIAGESAEDGVVLLYRPSPASIRQSVVYEWCNLLRIYRSDAAELFLLTEALEEVGSPARRRASYQPRRRSPGTRRGCLPHDRQKEQKKMCSAHLVPPSFVHSARAFCWASRGSVEVAQPTKLRSAASAPHCLLKTVSKTHALPRWEQMLMASFSARDRSLLPCDHPAPRSAAL